jgi:hypothetical protein
MCPRTAIKERVVLSFHTWKRYVFLYFIANLFLDCVMFSFWNDCFNAIGISAVSFLCLVRAHMLYLLGRLSVCFQYGKYKVGSQHMM